MTEKTVPSIIFRAGEGLPGGAPSWVEEVDFTEPLLQRQHRGNFADAVSNGNVLNLGRNVHDLHAFLVKHLRKEHGMISFTYQDLIDLVITGNPAFEKDHEEILARFKKHAPHEIKNARLNRPVSNRGANQLKYIGAVVAMAFLAAGGGAYWAQRIVTEGITSAVVVFGATGSTGVGFTMAMERWLPRVGVTTVTKFAMLAHQPSISVKRTVAMRVVLSVMATTQLVEGCILSAGLPTIDLDTGISRFWDDSLQFLPDIASNADNAWKLSKDDLSDKGITGELTTSVLLLMYGYRIDLPQRYLAYLLAHASEVTEEQAIGILLPYIEQRWLDFGTVNPSDGTRPVELKEYSAMALQHLRKLLPALAYLAHSDVTIDASRPEKILWWETGKVQKASIRLRGSDIVNTILEAAGLETFAELKSSINGQGATYAGLTAYEHDALEGSDEYTLEEIADEFNKKGYWHQEAWRLASNAFTGYNHYEPGKHEPHKHMAYLWTQPAVSPVELVVRALGLMGEVTDPRKIEAALALEREVALRLEQAKG